MVLEKIKFKIETFRKSEEDTKKYARLAETKEHLGEAVNQCKNIIEEDKLKGIGCICSKIQDKNWIDQDNIRVGKKLYM